MQRRAVSPQDLSPDTPRRERIYVILVAGVRRELERWDWVAENRLRDFKATGQHRGHPICAGGKIVESIHAIRIGFCLKYIVAELRSEDGVGNRLIKGVGPCPRIRLLNAHEPSVKRGHLGAIAHGPQLRKKTSCLFD